MNNKIRVIRFRNPLPAVLLSIIFLASCNGMAVTPQIATPTSMDKKLELSSTPVPSVTTSPLPTITPSPLPTLTFTPTPYQSPTLRPTFTLGPTPTLLSGLAPSLPHVDVQFIYNGPRDKPYVALTFDLCQKPEYPAWFDQGIYDALLEARARATFFVGGDWMRTHMDETRLLADNPLFELGNHSWDHPDLPDLDEAAISQEILKTQDLMYQITGKQPRLFRLPSGLYNDLVLSTIAWHGLYTIQWDVETADPVPDNQADNIQRIVREKVQNGSIIIMHANGRGWHTAEALPGMIEELRGRGFCLVTVPELIGMDPIPEECGTAG